MSETFVMPIMGEGTFCIPLELEPRAKRNHSQSFKRLRERQGISVLELYLIMLDMDLPRMPDVEQMEIEAAIWWKSQKVAR